MAEFINTIAVLGDDAVADSIIEKTITEFKDNLITSIGRLAFYMCSKLATVDVPNVSSINIDAFYSCGGLASVILRGEQICSLAHANVFNNTPIKSGTGYIYVPKSLVDSYKAATNWSTYANQFRALEDYTVDGTIMGELDLDKVYPKPAGLTYSVIQGYPASANTNSTFTASTNGATSAWFQTESGKTIHVSMTERTTNRFRIGFAKQPIENGVALYQPIAYDDAALEHTFTVPDGYTYVMVYLGGTAYPNVEPGFMIEVL
jgi:hypothetical protein